MYGVATAGFYVGHLGLAVASWQGVPTPESPLAASNSGGADLCPASRGGSIRRTIRRIFCFIRPDACRSLSAAIARVLMLLLL